MRSTVGGQTERSTRYGRKHRLINGIVRLTSDSKSREKEKGYDVMCVHSDRNRWQDFAP